MLPIHDWKDDIRTTEVHGERQIQRRRVLNQFLKTNVLRGGGEVQHCETLIVGGGIAGLYLAKQLPNSLVLERRTKVGGKVRTTYDDQGKPLFDDGPWRIHHSHHRMLQLLQSLSIETTTNASSSSSVLPQASACKPGLSTFGSNAVSEGIASARRKNVSTGYDGVHHAECTANVYHGQRHKGGDYLYVNGGMRTIVAKLMEQVGRRVQTGCMVTDVKKMTQGYTIHYQTLDGSTGTFTASNVIVCAPPEHVHFPSISAWLEDQSAAIQSLPLMHVYAKWEKPPPLGKRVVPDSALSQVIAGDLSDYFQLSYSAGDTARFLRDFHLNDPTGFRAHLLDEYRTHVDGNAPAVSDLQVRYWNDAVHMWRPILADSNKSVGELMQASVEPHPVQLPNLYWAGECFSTHQGWMEGALETADTVLHRMQHPLAVSTRSPDPAGEVVVHGRIVDVRNFQDKHPGSKAAIEKYLGQDATTAFGFIPHPAYAKSYVYMLQQGWAKKE